MASTSSTISLVPSRRSRPSTPENGLSENFYHEKLDREGAEEVSSTFDDMFFFMIDRYCGTEVSRRVCFWCGNLQALKETLCSQS